MFSATLNTEQKKGPVALQEETGRKVKLIFAPLYFYFWTEDP